MHWTYTDFTHGKLSSMYIQSNNTTSQSFGTNKLLIEFHKPSFNMHKSTVGTFLFQVQKKNNISFVLYFFRHWE